jgi:hypothetical protein
MNETNWQPIDTAPKDGSVIYLAFAEGRANVRGARARRRIWLPDRVVTGRWWTADDAFRRVGKRCFDGMRGARLARDGGYWGAAKKSKPLAGVPTHWMPYAPAGVTEGGDPSGAP